ncbi:MAG: F0F1 ATP synthase subunit A [Candidatus Mycalebacterium zealandia]|nr:MAG: F0F1 ATP synthase subunit A [Candidatus Mycalebacterium zealandia]
MEHFSWFYLLGLGRFDHIIGLGVVVSFLVVSGLVFRKSVSADTSNLPSDKLSFRNFVELIGIDFLLGMLTNILGSREKAKHYFPLLAGSFFFILFCNLLGIVPGFLPPTGTLNTTLAFGILIFIMYNFYGFRAHGTGYVKQFLGPVAFLAPLMFLIELVSHIVRPVSLSLRLFMNITGDHMVMGVFMNLTHFIIPALFIALGIFVSFLQAFIFTVLSAIYIGLAESHH